MRFFVFVFFYSDTKILLFSWVSTPAPHVSLTHTRTPQIRFFGQFVDTWPHEPQNDSCCRFDYSGCFVLLCAAVCRSVLQCDAVCCSASVCVAVVWRVLQWVTVYYSVGQCIAVCCSVFQCAAVCCSVLNCATSYCRLLYASGIPFFGFRLYWHTTSQVHVFDDSRARFDYSSRTYIHLYIFVYTYMYIYTQVYVHAYVYAHTYM